MSTSPVVQSYCAAVAQLRVSLLVRPNYPGSEPEIQENVELYAIVQQLHPKAARELTGTDLEVAHLELARASSDFDNFVRPLAGSFPKITQQLAEIDNLRTTLPFPGRFKVPESVEQHYCDFRDIFNMSYPQIQGLPNLCPKDPPSIWIKGDRKAIIRLKGILNAPEGTYPPGEIRGALRSLSVKTRRLAFQLLCKAHGCPYKSKDAIRYFVLKPTELLNLNVPYQGKTLPIICHLAQSLWQ